MWPPKTILHPTDFSENSQHAFELACNMAESMGGKIIVLHAFMPEVLAMGDLPPVTNDMENEAEVRHKLDLIRSSKPGMKIESKMGEGTAVEVIVNIAQSIKADLIVMGTYGRSGFKRLFLGSVADHVLRRAPCPVLIVPLPKQSAS